MDAKVDAWNSHHGRSREVRLDGRTFYHLHCMLCARDFVKPADGTEWRAAHVGIFQFNLLDETTNERWTSESCRGRPLAAESNDMRSALRS
jgi:hypothetical protein